MYATIFERQSRGAELLVESEMVELAHSRSLPTKKSAFQKRRTHQSSGRLDSNQRPPAPKAGALTGLRYTPLVFGRKGNNFVLTNEIFRKKYSLPYSVGTVRGPFQFIKPLFSS